MSFAAISTRSNNKTKIPLPIKACCLFFNNLSRPKAIIENKVIFQINDFVKILHIIFKMLKLSLIRRSLKSLSVERISLKDVNSSNSP